MESFEIRISKRYGYEHLETSSLPGTFVDSNGRGVLLRLTLGELHELRSRADYYADPNFRDELAESDLLDLHRSAIKVVEQIKRAGLWELAGSPESGAAYSVEWTEQQERAEREWAAWKAEQAAKAAS